MESYITGKGHGRAFELAGERAVILTGAADTDGAYSTLHWTVPVGASPVPFHRHGRYEESFFVMSGTLQMTLGDDTVALTVGDFARAPSGTRHSYVNLGDDPVEMLVTFTPGGIEELFAGHDTSHTEFDVVSFLTTAFNDHATEYEF